MEHLVGFISSFCGMPIMPFICHYFQPASLPLSTSPDSPSTFVPPAETRAIFIKKTAYLSPPFPAFPPSTTFFDRLATSATMPSPLAWVCRRQAPGARLCRRPAAAREMNRKAANEIQTANAKKHDATGLPIIDSPSSLLRQPHRPFPSERTGPYRQLPLKKRITSLHTRPLHSIAPNCSELHQSKKLARHHTNNKILHLCSSVSICG
jgi:hypothetical protein